MKLDNLKKECNALNELYSERRRLENAHMAAIKAIDSKINTQLAAYYHGLQNKHSPKRTAAKTRSPLPEP